MNGILTALLIPLAGTVIGAAFVFFLKREISSWMQKLMLGFASGVMVAASVWSLLIPSLELGSASAGVSLSGVFPAVIGLLAGFAFLLLIDYITPHLHPDGQAEGPKSRLSHTSKLMLAVTIHNLPEGMAVGAALIAATASVLSATPASSASAVSLASAFAISIGIAIQNIPEGAIISVPMKAAGNSRAKSFLLGCLSGIVEPQDDCCNAL
ncbi:MAG: ZIP family metal transporter [Bacteroidales bacterium]|nr:ZIP family metal transporter [Bacteroidales bacterium]